ncbi:MAG: DsbA family protein [Candidatus Eremiobacteraeota bacterium]|nr:DsbA family protein [Candidatus Eremiobacteraeota bacterium]
MHVELFLDTLSSWCLLAAPAWKRLQETPAYAGRVTFAWSLALVDRADALGYTPETIDWYYRRTAKMTGERLNPGWIDGPQTGTLNANLVTAAARTLGAADDRVWVALATAALREGRPMGRLAAAVEVGAAAAGLDPAELAARAQSEEVLEYVRDGTDRFRSLALPQRPSHVVTDEIGDLVTFSGLWTYEPLAAALDALLADVDGHRVYMINAPAEPLR